MQQLPVVIKKSFIGYVFITLVGLAFIALIAAGVYSMWRTGDLSEPAYWIAGFFAIVIRLITLLQLYVYNLSFIELTDTGLHVVNWRTIFVKQDARSSGDGISPEYRFAQ